MKTIIKTIKILILTLIHVKRQKDYFKYFHFALYIYYAKIQKDGIAPNARNTIMVLELLAFIANLKKALQHIMKVTRTTMENSSREEDMITKIVIWIRNLHK